MLGEGVRLPVVDLYLFTHIEKKIDVVGAHVELLTCAKVLSAASSVPLFWAA